MPPYSENKGFMEQIKRLFRQVTSLLKRVTTLENSSVSSASEIVKGIAELATQVETDAGTDDERIVTPLKIATYVTAQIATIPTAGFTEVGLGKTYTTIQTALAAGKYDIKLTSDITETINWGSITKKINIVSDSTTMRTINMSVTNTSALEIYFWNIKISVTGTNVIFTTNCNIFFDDCELLGDSSDNDFLSTSYSDGTRLKITTGSNAFQIRVRNFDYLEINGNGLTMNNSKIEALSGYINEVYLTGTTGTLNYMQYIFKISNTTVGCIISNYTNKHTVYVEDYSRILSGGSGRFNLKLSDGINDVIISNCHIDVFTLYTNSDSNLLVQNCDITTITYNTSGSFDERVYAVKAIFIGCLFGGSVKPFNNYQKYIGCTFAGTLELTGDYTVVTGCIGVTFTILTGSDNNKISGNHFSSTITLTSKKNYYEPKRYKAVISQTGTNAPTATIIENTLGEDPTYAYTNVGIYALNVVASIFTTSGLLILSPFALLPDGEDPTEFVSMVRASDTSIRINSYDTALANGLLSNTLVYFEIYP